MMVLAILWSKNDHAFMIIFGVVIISYNYLVSLRQKLYQDLKLKMKIL